MGAVIQLRKGRPGQFMGGGGGEGFFFLKGKRGGSMGGVGGFAHHIPNPVYQGEKEGGGSFRLPPFVE